MFERSQPANNNVLKRIIPLVLVLITRNIQEFITSFSFQFLVWQQIIIRDSNGTNQLDSSWRLFFFFATLYNCNK